MALNPEFQDDKGLLKVGNPSTKGRGNPAVKKWNQFRNHVAAVTSEKDVARIWKRLEKAADEGDVQAIKLFLQYTIGAPGRMEGENSGQQRFTVVINPPSGSTAPTVAVQAEVIDEEEIENE